jgi:nucleotide-binding universal stress UspA family protein
VFADAEPGAVQHAGRHERSLDGVLMRRLVAYDGSPSAQRALLHAAALHRDGDDLGLIHVNGPHESANGHLDEGCRTLASLGIEAVPIEVSGIPAHAICVAAERHAFDTIVIGRRNLRDAGLVLLGSVAARVVAGAPGHVVVVA